MAASQFGTDYSRWFTPVPGEAAWIPFPNPTNDGQKVQNARARAARAGVNIGSGYLNPKSGELQDPDRGLGRSLLARPELMIPLVLGGGYAAGTLLAPAAASAGSGGVALGNVNAITDSLAASHAAGGSAAVGGLGSLNPVIDRLSKGGAEDVARGGARGLLDNLLSPEGLTTAGSIAATLAMRGDGTNDQTRASEEQARRMQAITEARMRRVDPLHEAITQLAFSRLPISSRQGINLSRVALPEQG